MTQQTLFPPANTATVEFVTAYDPQARRRMRLCRRGAFETFGDFLARGRRLADMLCLGDVRVETVAEEAPF
jgi:hypothetical protein